MSDPRALCDAIYKLLPGTDQSPVFGKELEVSGCDQLL